MKKIIVFLLLISLILPTVPILAEAEEIWEPTVAVSDFTYSKDSLTGGDMTVSCTVRKINTTDNIPVPYSFVTVVKKFGKIVDIQKYDAQSDSLLLTNDKKGYPSVTVTIPNDTNGVKVESFFLNSVIGGKILAPKAIFLSDECGIEAIYVDGKRVESFKAENSETELILPPSYAHTPDIQVVAKNSSSKVTVSKVTSLSAKEKTTVGIVVKQGSATVRHKLLLSLKPGSVTNAKMLKTAGSSTQEVNIKTDTVRVPDYGFKQDGVTPITPSDEGFSYVTNLPIDKTLLFSDRNWYYATIPYDLVGATAVQMSRQIIMNDALYLDKANALEELGSFTIDCSADIYLYGGGAMDWAKAEGYKRAASADTEFAYDTEKLSSFTAYHKRVYVKEGETAKVKIGNAVNSAGGETKNMSFIVKFIEPDSVMSLDEVKVEGVSDFSFDPDVTEYTIELDEGTTLPPEISYKLSGFGATSEVTKATSVPGTTEIKVKSGDGTQEKTYKFNFKVFETVLSDLKVGGTTIEGFDKNTYEYTYSLPYGWKASDGIPEVTASGSEFVDIIILQATADSMLAKVTVSAEKGTTKEYKVTFKETLTLPSSPATAAFNTPVFVQAKTTYIDSPMDNANMVTRTYKDTTTSIHASGIKGDTTTQAGGTTLYPSVALIELDLSQLKNLDTTKETNLYMFGSLGSYATSGNADVIVSFYDATGTDMDAVTIEDIRNISKWVQDDKLLDTTTLTGQYWKQTNMTVSLSGVIDKYYGTGVNPIIALYIGVPETNDDARTRFQLTFKYGSHTSIKYYKYDK